MSNDEINHKLSFKSDFREAALIDSSEKGDSYLLVTENDKYLKVSPTTYFILKKVNDGFSAAEIAELINQKQAIKILAQDIIKAYDTLFRKIEVINGGNSTKKRGFWFLWEIIPAKWVQIVSRPLSVAFRPVVGTALMLLILFGLIYNFQAKIFLGSYSVFLSPQSFWTGYFLFFLSTIVHEFGHASASSRFGAAPSGIGLTVYLIFPALYSDVTGSWKLKSKERFIVGLGGIYFQLIASAVYSFLYCVTGADFFRVAILMIMANCLLNLNPFFKFDGYWILADLLGVVNLGEQPRRLLNHFISLIRRRATNPLPWSATICVLLTFYSIGSFLIFGIFTSIYLSHVYFQINFILTTIESILTTAYQNGTVAVRDLHTIFLSCLPLFIFAYICYTLLGLFGKKLRLKIFKIQPQKPN